MTDADKQLSAIDTHINRQNIALARSHKLLQSWLPPKASDHPPTTTADEDEQDFQNLGEVTGIGAKRKNEEDSELGGILKRRRTDNDKLLESLIGKKAAQARKKSQEAVKGRHAAPKPLEAQKQRIVRNSVESEDEDEGRASAFTSKKRNNVTKKAQIPDAVSGGESEDVVVEDVEPPNPRDDATVVEELVKEAAKSEADDARPKKRKAGSYLDELLAQKAKRKSKKKKKGKSDV